MMVWIHGGGLIDARTHDFDLRKIVKDGDVVAVSITYRMNAFGYMAHPDLDRESHPLKVTNDSRRRRHARCLPGRPGAWHDPCRWRGRGQEPIHPGFHSADICRSMAVTMFPPDTDPLDILDASMKLSHFGGSGRLREKQIKPPAEILGRTPDQADRRARCRSAWQPNPGRRSTYRSGKSVRTSGATSGMRIGKENPSRVL